MLIVWQGKHSHFFKQKSYYFNQVFRFRVFIFQLKEVLRRKGI